MHGHVIKHSEMVVMCVGYFRVQGCRGVEGIQMVLKISEMHKCQNMRKCGFTCVERVHTHQHMPQCQGRGMITGGRKEDARDLCIY